MTRAAAASAAIRCRATSFPRRAWIPLALKLLEYWPKANQTGNADFRQNYFRTRDINRDDRNLTGKVDHNFSEQHRMFFRLSNNQHDNLQDTLPGLASGTILDRTTYGAVLDDVYVFNPQTLLNVRYGLTYEDDATVRRSQLMDLTTLGFPQSLVNEINTKGNEAGIAFPQMTVDGLQKLGDAGGNRVGTIYHTWAGTLTRMTGSHSLRMGGEYRLQRENGFNYGAVSPNLTFTTNWTRGPLDTDTTSPNGVGQGLASLLFGLPTSGNVAINASRAEQSSFAGLYIHDDWRITPRLSLNIGLRWEFEGADTERFNRSVRGFDFGTPSPISQQAAANYAKAPDPILPAFTVTLTSVETAPPFASRSVSTPRDAPDPVTSADFFSDPVGLSTLARPKPFFGFSSAFACPPSAALSSFLALPAASPEEPAATATISTCAFAL